MLRSIFHDRVLKQALDCAQEDMRSPNHVLSSSELREMLGADVMPLFRLLFAQMAASCAALAFALREAASGKRVSNMPCMPFLSRSCARLS